MRLFSDCDKIKLNLNDIGKTYLQSIVKPFVQYFVVGSRVPMIIIIGTKWLCRAAFILAFKSTPVTSNAKTRKRYQVKKLNRKYTTCAD